MNRNGARKPSTFKPEALPARWGGTPRDIAEEWLATYYSYSPNTIRIYRETVLARFVPWLEENGIEELADLRPVHITAFMQAEFNRPRKKARRDGDRGQFISSSSLLRLFQNLKSFLKWCVASEYLVHSPMDNDIIRAPKQPLALREAFTREEAQRLIRWNAFKGIRAVRYRDRALVTLMLDTGLRAAELLSLQVDSIETRVASGGVRLVGAEEGKRVQRWLKIRGKGRKDRFVRVGDEAFKAVNAWMRVRMAAPGSDALWTTIQGTPLDYQALYKMLLHLGEYAGVENVYPHRFRHTAATELYLETKDIELVRHMLGHEDISITARYLRRVGMDYQTTDYRTPGEWLA